MSTQLPLLNTRTMTSSRKMNAVLRARAQASYSKQQGQIVDPNILASPAEGRVLFPTPCPERSRAMPKDCLWIGMDMNFPDEERFWPLAGLDRCDVCYRCAFLYRTVKGYQLRCGCQRNFMTFKTSQDAIQHWKLSSKLSEL